MSPYIELFLIYLAVINIVSAIVCVYDKIMAIKGRYRVSEATLILLSVLGGSVLMLVAMKLIRHKTKHKKFMLGIPIIIILQLVILFFAFGIDKILI